MTMTGSPSAMKSWSETFKRSVRGKHTWTIENFEVVEATLETGKALESPEFSVGICLGNEERAFPFQLEVYPNNEEKELEAFVAVFLTSLYEKAVDVKYSFSVPLLNVQTENLIHKFTHQDSWGIEKVFPKDKLYEKLKETPSITSVTIICHFEVFHGNYECSGNTFFKVPKSLSLKANLGKFYENTSDHADVTLLCGEKSFPCHKFVLSARSPVFDTMFRNKPMKGPIDIVEISDAVPQDLEKFLRFLYSDDLVDLPDFQDISPLLVLAHKYKVDKLKLLCEKRICDIVTPENVLDAAKVACLTNSSHLLSFTIDFMAKDLHKIVATPEFAKIAKICPKLLVEILKNTPLPL